MGEIDSVSRTPPLLLLPDGKQGDAYRCPREARTSYRENFVYFLLKSEDGFFAARQTRHW